MQTQSRNQHSRSMINQKFNEASYKEEFDSTNPVWNEISTPHDGMRLTNPDFKIDDNKNAEMKTMNQPEIKTYTCQMHPEITTDQPGRCPNCGMAFIEEK